MMGADLAAVKVAAWVHHGLGDVIMTLPALAAMDRALPSGSKILFLVKSNTEAQLLSLINWQNEFEVLVMYHSGRGFMRAISFVQKVRDWNPDYFIAPHASDSFATALFSRLIGAGVSVGPSGKWSWFGFSQCIDYLAGGHKAQYYSFFFEKAGLNLSLIHI